MLLPRLVGGRSALLVYQQECIRADRMAGLRVAPASAGYWSSVRARFADLSPAAIEELRRNARGKFCRAQIASASPAACLAAPVASAADGSQL
eukprot:2964771-Alexandrium_andersonii.AAC.1